MRIRAVVGSGVWFAALVGSLVAGCGGEAGVDYQEPGAPESESVSEAAPTDDTLAASEGDSGEMTQALGGCAGTTVSWSQWQPSWNSNTNTQGTYFCYGTVPSAGDGFTFPATLTSSDRTGSAQFTCSNGMWVLQSGSCNGKVITVFAATGHTPVCSSSDPVRQKWIGWYLADLKRCPDSAGLDWWVTQYNNNTACPASTNYDGYGTKDACWRANFQMGANANGNSYNEAQMLGHISSWDENNFCGQQAGYPWASVSTNGTTCKYKP